MMAYQDKGMEMTVFLTNEDMENMLSGQVEGPLDSGTFEDKRIFTKLFMKVDDKRTFRKLIDVIVDDRRNYDVAVSKEYHADLNKKGFYPKVRYGWLAPSITSVKESYAESSMDYSISLMLTRSAFRRAGLIS